MDEQKKYKELCDKLMKGLRMETVPVAVQFSTNPPEGVPQFKGGQKACQLLDEARLEGKTFYTTVKILQEIEKRKITDKTAAQPTM